MDDEIYCTRTDNACTGRACWICRGDTFTTTPEPKDGE